jgi:hypothetical protein
VERIANQSLDERLIGSWRLLSLQMEVQDKSGMIEPWGSRPHGFLVVTPQGRLMTVTTASDRTLPETDADAAALLGNMVCYSGKTQMDGTSRFVTDVDVAWHPSWLRTRQARSFSMDGDILSVRTDSLYHPAYPGRLVSFILCWQREA